MPQWLPQREAALAGPDADEVQRAQLRLAILTAPRSLAVRGQERLLDARGLRRLCPHGQTAGEELLFTGDSHSWLLAGVSHRLL